MSRPVMYKCSDGRSFSVTESADAAKVDYFNEHFQLPRRPSGIGTRYASADATLIIDGDMAAFVTETIVDLQACRAL